jgi:RND family efflux transporter MFP subunit
MTRRHRLALLLAVAAAASCGKSGTTAPAVDAARAVLVARVTRGDLSRSIELAAEFRPYQQIDLHAKVAGFLKDIYVDIGDQVKTGQLIAVLEAPEMTQESAQTDAALKRAEVDVDRARADEQRSEAEAKLRQEELDRLSGVVKVRANLVAQQDVDDVRARVQEADAQLASAKAAIASAEAQVQVATAAKERDAVLLSYLRIAAPFSGVITNRLADPGAMIQAGTASHVQAMPVVQLSQVDRLRLVLPVPESVVPRVRVNAPVEIRVDALKRVFQGRISRFTGKLDTSTRTMDTEVDLPNPDLTITAGMFGYATLVLDQRSAVLSIPVQALAGRSLPLKVLMVGSDGTLAERAVETGLETPDRIEVTSGLKEGDLVVVGASSDLKPGQHVIPKIQTASTDAGGG